MTTKEFLESDKFKQMLKDHNLSLEDFTCNDCGYESECPCSYDPYNTNGDCLEEK